MFLFSSVIRWFSNSTYLICLFEPWRRQPGAGLPSPRQEGRRNGVGLPTPEKTHPTSTLASEHGQPPLDQTQGVSVQYHPSGNDLTSLATGALVQFQPGGTALTLPQSLTLNRLTFSAETMTPRCLLLPSCTTLPHLVDKSKADAQSGLSAHNTTDRRKCVACCMCGQQFSHGEARLQQWSNRHSQRAYACAQCVNGGVAHDHEQHPKQDAVARQRDCLLEREVALRLDFQWSNTVTWDCIKDLRGTAFVQPPPRFEFAPQQAQHAILRAITYHGPFSLAPEPAWKTPVLSSWLLWDVPLVSASESNCDWHFLEARLDLFWAEDWPALWAPCTVRAECDVAPIFSAKRRTTTEQKQSPSSQSGCVGSIR